MGITIIDIRVAGICSKCRTDGDDTPKDKYGNTYEDKDIVCFNCQLK